MALNKKSKSCKIWRIRMSMMMKLMMKVMELMGKKVKVMSTKIIIKAVVAAMSTSIPSKWIICSKKISLRLWIKDSSSNSSNNQTFHLMMLAESSSILTKCLHKFQSLSLALKTNTLNPIFSTTLKAIKNRRSSSIHRMRTPTCN